MTYQAQLDLTFDTVGFLSARALEMCGTEDEDPEALEEAAYIFYGLRMWSASERCREKVRRFRQAQEDTP